MELNERLFRLKEDLRSLHRALRQTTYKKYKRINPFYEDLFDWKERGQFWCEKDKGITIYNSTTLQGDVEIGENTWIGPFCSLDGGGGLVIGKFCSISAGVQVLTHDTVRWALSGGTHPYEYAPVKIDDCCFVGTDAIITKGVTIGNHCVIGAGAVITKDISPYSVVAGVPGVVIGNVRMGVRGEISIDYGDHRSDLLRR